MQLNEFQKNALKQVMSDLVDNNPEKDRLRDQLPASVYWRQIGASVIVAPRQKGKTVFTQYLKDAFGHHVKLIDWKTTAEQLRGINDKVILVVDEWDMMDRDELSRILSLYKYRHVVLVGSLS